MTQEKKERSSSPPRALLADLHSRINALHTNDYAALRTFLTALTYNVATHDATVIAMLEVQQSMNKANRSGVVNASKQKR